MLTERPAIPLLGGAHRSLHSFSGVPDPQVVTLSGCPGQMGTWACCLDGEVGAWEAWPLAQDYLFVDHCGIRHFAPGCDGVYCSVQEAHLSQGGVLEPL